MQFCSDSVLSVAWECFLGPFLAVSSHYLRPIPDSFLHTRIRMIAFYGFSISHYFSLPTNSAHCHQMSLKTFSGGICLVRLHPIQTVWHSNFCICDSYLPMFLAMTSQHKLFASSHFYCRVLTHLDSLIFYPILSARCQQLLTGTTSPKQPLVTVLGLPDSYLNS